MLRFISLFFVLSLAFGVMGQDLFTRKKKALVQYRTYRRGGWMFAPGITYMWGRKTKDEKRDITQKGRIAVYAEVGRFQIFKDEGNVFNYFDYSLAYKRLSGTEEFAGSKAVFKQNYILGNFNVNNIWQRGDYTFIQNSLGVNLDYKFMEKYESNGSGSDNTGRTLFSLHYKIGYGIKARGNLFIIPSIEVPILNVMEWEKGKSTYGIFSSRYKPIIFSIRFAFLRKRNMMSCPDNDLSPEDKKKQDMHLMGQ